MGTTKQNQDLDSTWIIDSSNDTYILGKNAKITTSGEFAIEILDGSNNNDIILKGDVKATETQRAVSILGNGHHLEVAASSHIDGKGANVGVLSNGANFTMENAGKIQGDSSAVSVSDFAKIENIGSMTSAQTGINAGAGLELTNSGKIEGDAFGILGYSEGTVINNLKGGQILSDTGAIHLSDGGDALINNAGLIKGQTAISDGDGDSTVINKGTISGNVFLGAGDDLFNTRNGNFGGTVNGGDGNDTYIIGDKDTDIVEQPSFGKDVVKTTVSFTIGENIEELYLQGAKNINGTGNEGNNTIEGNKGDNVLRGLDGDDYLAGGKGNDLLIGGANQDLFEFNKGTGDDVIKDFSNGEDVIFSNLANDGPTIEDLLENHVKQKGDDLLITYGDDSLLIKNMEKADLDATDFFTGL